MSSPNTTPPPRSPCRVTDDLLDLAQQITPSKQSRGPARVPSVYANSANRAADADESIENPNTLEDHTREKGRLFTIQEALFLVDNTMFEVEEDEDFDEGAEFSTDKNKIQGQLRQVLRYLPNDAKPFRSTTLVSGAFADGMSGQWSTTSNHLRDASLVKMADDIKLFGSCVPGHPAFILPHRRLPAVSHPPHPLCNIPLQHPRAGRSRKIASRLRTAAIPVPRGICNAMARVNIVVEHPV
ncbi:hypothetical protein B0H14DRAFT_2597424 [Mycena olivaceomarginata]|nr:hypothetical protein B0H14DRAFT_2597424 [Mycena olivaceomarginata]